MSMNWKRLSGLFLALAMVLTLLPVMQIPARGTGDALAQAYVEMLLELK